MTETDDLCRRCGVKLACPNCNDMTKTFDVTIDSFVGDNCTRLDLVCCVPGCGEPATFGIVSDEASVWYCHNHSKSLPAAEMLKSFNALRVGGG